MLWWDASLLGLKTDGIAFYGTTLQQQLLLYAAQVYRVAYLAEGMARPLMKYPLKVRAGIWNLFMVPEIARLLFVKDNVGSLMSTNSCRQTRCLV